MAAVTRNQVLDAESRGNQEQYSVLEIASLMGIPVNTAKSHFARNGFNPMTTAGRGKRIYGHAMLKRYGLWLYLARESEGLMGYTALQRDEILNKLDLDDLWTAFKESPESLVQKLMKIQSGVVVQ